MSSGASARLTLAIAERYGACDLRVFGSVVSGEAGVASDVDFLVELVPEPTLMRAVVGRDEVVAFHSVSISHNSDDARRRGPLCLLQHWLLEPDAF
jgi:predicted nucleotidyltransferase